MSLPPFNPSRQPAPKSEPGEGDDLPCVKCGAVALDTGLECSECGHDNYEAVTGKPFGVTVRSEAQLLHEAHDQLHRLVATFVPGNDGAYTETTDLMRRIREALPGVTFDGGTAGVGEVPRG